MNELAVTYKDFDGQELAVTAQDIRSLICEKATDKEISLFLKLCEARKLNPFVKEAYLIKYKDSQPATMVVSKDVYTKRAAASDKFEGFQAGITVIGFDGGLHRREGSMILHGETIVGAWCKVFVKGYQEPIYDEVAYSEYVAKKYDGSPNQQWASKPGTMLRKVAVVHALREAFPDLFAGLYESTEMGIEEPTEQEVIEIENDPVEAVLEPDFVPNQAEG